jgi:hypothetical protein
VQLVTQDEGHAKQFQVDREITGALPLKSVECAPLRAKERKKAVEKARNNRPMTGGREDGYRYAHSRAKTGMGS